MAAIRNIDTPAQTGPGLPDEALGPKDEAFEAELERAEAEEGRENAKDHGKDIFGEHEGGVGQTLGGDLLRPNPGRDLPPEPEDDDD
jgi:hypothetical protein